jgi:hypothetical protein
VIRRHLRTALVAVVAVAVAVGVALVPGTASAVTVRPTGPLSPSSGALFGALVNPDRTNPSSTQPEVLALEAEISRKLAIVNHFYPYKQAVGTQGEVQDISGGRIPMITWGATDSRRIRNGLEDAWIKQQARAIKNLGAPVFLRYYHEPDGDYRKTMVHTPADYIAAWKRARNLFTQVGATNVVWVFCTTTYSFRVKTAVLPQAYYPGDAYVDWIGGDGYNFAPVKPGAQWNTFSTVFGKWYTWASQRPKPLMAAEYGALEDPNNATAKSGWYDDMHLVVPTNFPLLQAVIAWSTENTKDGLVYNWNVDSSTAALNAWTAMANDRYFAPA